MYIRYEKLQNTSLSKTHTNTKNTHEHQKHSKFSLFMEDDDEFGDLYTDVLRPLTTSFQSQAQNPTAPPPPFPHLQEQTKQLPKATSGSKTSFLSRPIDLNVNSDGDDNDVVDNKFFGAPYTPQNQTLAASKPGFGFGIGFGSRPEPRGFDLNKESGQEAGSSEGLGGDGDKSDLQARVLEAKGGDVELREQDRGSTGLMDEADIDVVVEESEEKDDDVVVKDENLGDRNKTVEDFMGRSGNVENFSVGEGGSGSGVMGLDPMIPGVSGGVENRANANLDDDWDSDSEDDLQIVLNDNNHGPMEMERTGGMGGEEDDEDDEDGEPLVIVEDNDDPSHQQMIMEEQEWGGDVVGPGGDGEKKELGEAAKVNGVGGSVVAPKMGYNNQGYHHQFHSQFKYVRPGASPMAGAPPVGAGGTPGHVRPPVGMVPVAGRGRGDWRPTGTKGFHPGYGMPIWGSGTSGRGLEFTLPSHKTIFEVDIDGFEEKPWKLPGVDVTDFFNFGLNEESWKDYCKQLEQLRLETTMQSKIRVYESGRAEQEYDPDLPPELAAAAGIQDIPSDSAKLGKTDAVQNDIARGTARVRPPLPTGRAIQVETGYGERLPSIDTRKPRISDLDVIIEIVCQDSADNDTNPGNEMADQAENDPARKDLRDDDEFEDVHQKDMEHFGPHAYSSCKREVMGRRKPFPSPVDNNMAEGDSLPFSSEAPSEYHPDSREQTPVNSGRSVATSHDERRTKGRPHDRSPIITNKGRTIDERFSDNKESSIESIDGKHSPLPSPPVAEAATEQSIESKDPMKNEIVQTERGSDMNKEELALNATTKNDTFTDETGNHASKKQKQTSQVEPPLPHEIDDREGSKAARSSENSKARSGSSNHASKKQKLTSQVEPPLPHEIDDREGSKAARSSENSKARSGSSNYPKLQDNVEEEEVQGRRLTRTGNLKRSIGGDEDTVRKKIRDERQENERHRSAVKGREDLYQHKGWDPYSGHHFRGKSQSIDLRKDVDHADGGRQPRDDDLQGRRSRAEDARKREHGDETVFRHRNKVREIERNERDEHHQLRKHMDNGSWRGSYDSDIGSRHRDRDDKLKSRNENIGDLHNKRRKDEAHLRREHADKEEILRAHREISSHRKRERDDVSDQRRRDDQARIRDDEQRSVRHKEEGLFQRERGERQREREEWHRLKQLNEEALQKDKEEARVGMRSGRTAEEKTWGSQSRGKDERKSSDKDYHSKDAGRQNELLNRRGRAENESLPQHRGREDFSVHRNQLNNDERRARHERSNTRDDRAANASDNYKVHERKHRENPRKDKESDGVDRSTLAFSKKNQDEISGQISDTIRFKGRVEQGASENEIHVNNRPSRKHREEASSDDELSESRRGRSKLERWTSHVERDFSISTKSSSLMKIKQIEAYSSTGPSVVSKLHDEASKIMEDNPHPRPHNEKDAVGVETSNNDTKPIEDRHLDTVEKLKKRSERFKLPMPIEKEATAIKKMENEPLPSAQSENRADFEIKAERPARKRRWTGN